MDVNAFCAGIRRDVEALKPWQEFMAVLPATMLDLVDMVEKAVRERDQALADLYAAKRRQMQNVRLLMDGERIAVGLDPAGGFDGPTGAD